MEGKEIIDNIIIGRVEPYIYAFTTNTVPNYLKIGDTYRPVKIRLNEWKKYFPDLKEEYKEKAMINSDVFFRDYSVHKYIEEELGKARLKEKDISKEIYYSNEFFKNAIDTDVKEAIEDIKESYEKNDNKYQYYDANTSLPEIFQYKREEKEWQPRPNQKEVIENFKKARKNGRKNLLMYAVMRFGKSFTSMMCAKEMNADLVVIVSAKADVKLEWKRNVEIPKNFEGYSFITAEELSRNNNEISERLSKGEKVVVFLTLQDLQGDLIKEKHKDLFKNKIDLLIVDETHFGARAEKYGKILKSTKYEKDIKDKHHKEESNINDLNENLKILDVDTTLHLSGTPYRILMGSEFEKEDIISFCQFSDIVEEQEKWNNENILNDEIKEWDNPYFGFPQMVRFAFNPSKKAKEKLKEYQKNGYTYAFSALLKPKSIKKADDDSHKKFVNEQEILELFEVIDGSKEDENVLGFLNYDKIKQGKMCRHIVCVLPYCASCDALEELIKNNKNKFKNLNEYEIINISGVDNSNQYRTIAEIKDKIRECEENDVKTLTLTVNRMLTGSTVEQWDTMIYLKDTSSPQEYDQAIFRLQNQYIKKYVDNEQNVIKYNMKPQTLLVDFDPYRMFVLQEQKSKIYNVNVEESGNSLLEERLKNELRISPIITINKNKIVEIEPKNIMDAVSEYSKEKGVMDEVNDIPVDLKLLENDEIKNVIDRQAELGSNKGLSVDNTSDEDGDDLDTSTFDSEDNTNGDTTDSNGSEENIEINNEESVNYEKKIRTYFARILFYSFLTKDDVISLLDVVKSIDYTEDNKRIAKNLGLNSIILKLMNDSMDVFKLSQLDYKIQNINKLSHDESLKTLERAEVAMNKFKKISQSEIITPINVCKNMYDLIDKKELIEICNNNGKILDIASKMGEFSIGLYEVLLEIGLRKDNFNNIIYSIPTSSIAYEFTRKIYDILGLNIENIALLFNSYDLLSIKDRDGNVDYNELNNYLLQNKKFNEIELEKNMFYVKGDERMKFDLVVGNPPYQEESNSKSSSNAQKPRTNIFQHFQEQAMSLTHNKTVLIYPGIRWIHQSGKGLKKFGYNLINNCNLERVSFYPNAKEIFDDTDIPDGVAIVVTNKNKKDSGFKYDYIVNNKSVSLKQNNPGEDLLIINPKDIDIVEKIKQFVVKNNLTFLSSEILPRGDSLFGIDNDLIIKNKEKSELFNGQIIDYKNKIKVLTNDKPGPAGRTMWFVIDKDLIAKNVKYISEWQVVVSSAHPGGQDGRNNQLAIVDNHSAFGRARVALKSFETEKEASNFKKYINSKFVKYALLLTDEALTSLAKYVPNFKNYIDNTIINFSEPIDVQLYQLIGLTEDEIKYIESKVKEN